MSAEKEQILNMIDKIRSDVGLPKDNKTQDEVVDGPKVCADILKALPIEQREKLLVGLKTGAPQVFGKVVSNFFRFDDLVHVTDKSIQILIQKINHEDLVLAFRGANRSLQTKFLKNMSKRKMQILLNDIEDLPPRSNQETNEAINRIEQLVDTLRTEGQVVSVN